MAQFMMFSAVIIFAVQAVCFKVFAKKYFKSMSAFMVYTVLFFAGCVAVLLLVGGIRFQNMLTIPLGAAFGILLALNFFFMNSAFQRGSMATAALFSSASILIPIVVDMLLFGTQMHAVQFAALVLFLLSFFIVSRQPEEHKPQKGFYPLCIGVIFCNGAVMSLIPIHQRLVHGLDRVSFLQAGFFLGAAAALIVVLLLRKRDRLALSDFKSRGFAFLVAGTVLTTAVGNMMNLELANLVPPVIQFPCVIGGGIIVNLLSGRVFFREKISITQVIGIVVCIAALIIMNL